MKIFRVLTIAALLLSVSACSHNQTPAVSTAKNVACHHRVERTAHHCVTATAPRPDAAGGG